MKHKKKIIAGILTTGAILAAHFTSSPIKHIGPPEAYPDPSLTPGLVATSDYKELTSVETCGTYSQCHRKTTSSMKGQVCMEYPANCTGTQEIDHFCPLALGCADDVKNLWAEPLHVVIDGQDWGYKTKDKLEAYLVNQMKGRQISPKDAQDCILNDWVACYNKYVPVVLGSTNQDVILDPDAN